MRILKPSPTSHLKGIRNSDPNPSKEIVSAFERLKAIFSSHNGYLRSERPSKWDFELWSRYGYRTKSNHPQYIKSVLFASISLYEKHVSVYFYPIYLEKSMVPDPDSPLSDCLTGKCTFHFSKLTLEKETALMNLIEQGVQFYKSLKLV